MAITARGCAKTRSFPRSEAFGLTTQIRRAAASIPANVAEGNGREDIGSYIQFLLMSQGALQELETHVSLSQMVELMNAPDAEQILEMTEEIGKLLQSLIKTLRDKEAV